MAAESSDDDRTCMICMSEPRAVRFHPCGHSVACELCTLQIIAKCPGSSKPESLMCTHCKKPITKIEKDKKGAPKISRQKTFVQPPSLDPLSIVQHAITAQAPSADETHMDVADFISSNQESPDKETREAAEAAAKTWADGSPPAGLGQLQAQLAEMQRQAQRPPHPLIRAIAGVVAVLFLCVFAWGMKAIVAIRADFDAYLASDNFTVQVTTVPGLEGPVNALIPPCTEEGGKCDVHLAEPTAHQQWWALISSYGSEDTEDVALARAGVFYLVVVQTSVALLKPVHAVLLNRPNTIQTLSNGLELTVGMAMLGALFPMYWDAADGLTLIMYIPGWAIAWSCVWMAITTASCLTVAVRMYRGAGQMGRGSALLCCFATGSCCYWMWFLYVPLISYALFFALQYVEFVTEQARDADALAAMPFSGASAAALYLPIRVAAGLGIFSWVGANFFLPKLNTRLLQPRGAAAPTAGTELV